jgi:hypothetical protein
MCFFKLYKQSRGGSKMKKVLILTLVLLVGMLSLFSQVSMTEAPEEQIKQALTTNPLGSLFGFYNVSYERALSSSGSIQVSALVQSLNLGIAQVSTFGGGAAYRNYLHQTAPSGFYVAPSVSVLYSSAMEDIYDTEGSVRFLLIGGVAGYQWISTGGFVFDFSAALNAIFGGPIEPITSPGIGFAVGYGW